MAEKGWAEGVFSQKIPHLENIHNWICVQCGLTSNFSPVFTVFNSVFRQKNWALSLIDHWMNGISTMPCSHWLLSCFPLKIYQFTTPLTFQRFNTAQLFIVCQYVPGHRLWLILSRNTSQGSHEPTQRFTHSKPHEWSVSHTNRSGRSHKPET